MRNPNTEIIPLIKKNTLSLLMTKNPDQIGMRDIAKACGITATNIYHYYRDKDTLFQEIGLDSIKEVNKKIVASLNSKKSLKEQVKKAITVFRDWCFENPRLSLLVMQGFKSADSAPEEVIEEYYVCNRTGEQLLAQAIKENLALSKNPRLDIGILVSGLWGCIESVLLKKCDVEYWNKGKAFTNHFIDMWLDSIFIKED
ncbi:TetR/AcrR family transcriptional regulator [Treponema sp.]|uniref:TetR/AcrR family transcriptional regulator n=1 Tax=Treponema sp. TaxID=166 RepID=UPI0025DA76F4|nr:TetR/AcrR family transcriptional regulator [Treponema sp.]MCR5218710.1 TetR/AcrR family transcriptional regulator [Treponema sp.]